MFSGVLLGLSYPFGSLVALHATAFLPILHWLETNPSASPRKRASVGFLFGVVAHAISQNFEYAMFEISWLASLLYVTMLGIYGARFAVTFALAGWLRRRTGLSWALLLPVCWIPLEWLGTFTDLRMTIDHLAHTLTYHPFLIQFADVVGHYGVGTFLLAVNGLLFEATLFPGRPRRLRAGMALILLLAAVVGYDLWAWNRDLPTDGTLRVAVVQPNIPLSVKHDRETAAEQWAALRKGTLEAAAHGTDVVVWPESARPWLVRHHLDRPETYTMPEVEALARSADSALLLGVEYAQFPPADDPMLYNATMVVDAEGRLLDEWGAKVYLVPFTEGVPFRSLLGRFVEGKSGEWRWLAGGFTPGPRGALVTVEGVRIGALVCFEQLFPDLSRTLRNAGAEIQVVVTNDAWFGRSYLQSYLANALRLRAIESRVEFVRAANTGISGFVDRRGVYHERTELFEDAVIVRDVEHSSARTIYDRIGDLAAWLAGAVLILLSAAAATRSRV